MAGHVSADGVLGADQEVGRPVWETRSSLLEAVSDSLCLSKTVCVFQRESVSFRDSLCLSQTVCVSVTDSLCQ